jgi:hypothetical protein
MSEKLTELAHRLERKPWNQPGADKTWVLQALWQHQLFSKEVRSAERVAAR